MRGLVCLTSFVLIALHGSVADAELVFFSTGRSLSVKGHRAEGQSLVLMLRGGGEMICEASQVARIEPDEVPYPETVPTVRLKPDTTTDSPYADARSVRLPPSHEASADRRSLVRLRAKRYGETATKLEERSRGGGGQADLQPDSRYDPIIDTVAARHGVDATLVRAVIQVESAYERRARSPKGAMGLMQLMPATARQYSVEDPYDPESNIEAGTRHLKSLMERLPLTLAIAAYNAGEAAVQRFRAVPPYPETRQYVARVLHLAGR
jgi:Transglycosylase SLT domain